jgi:hypothetical protein
MKRSKINDHQMLTRLAAFSARYAGLFPEYTAAPQVVDALGAAVTRLSAHAASVVTGAEAVRAATNAREAARTALRQQLDLVDHTARALKLDKFKAKRPRTDQALLNLGCAFLAEAELHKAEFVQCGLKPEVLHSAIDALKKACNTLIEGKALRAGAIQEFEKTLVEAYAEADKLNALVQNTLRDHPTVIAAWDVARRIDRRTGRKSATSAPPSAPADANPAESSVSP